jgi:hypothetical protein
MGAATFLSQRSLLIAAQLTGEPRNGDATARPRRVVKQTAVVVAERAAEVLVDDGVGQLLSARASVVLGSGPRRRRDHRDARRRARLASAALAANDTRRCSVISPKCARDDFGR